MSNEAETVRVSAVLTTDLMNALDELAKRRGLSANTVLQQAIATEKFMSDEIGMGSKILVEKPDRSFTKIEFNNR